MGACADLRGVRSVDATYAQELEIEATVQTSEPLLTRLGVPVCMETYRSVNRINLTGAGDLPEGLVAAGSMSVTGLTGGVIRISETTEEQETGRYHRFTVQANHYPFATDEDAAP
jgi:hypothetical protein